MKFVRIGHLGKERPAVTGTDDVLRYLSNIVGDIHAGDIACLQQNGFEPIGAWFIPREEPDDASNLPLTTRVNGTVLQQGSTADTIFSVTENMSYVSRFMTLVPGDIIATGMPAGVGVGQKLEPIFLKAGDLVELEAVH